MVRVGESVEVHACKADGTVYRSWRGTVESVCGESLTVLNRAGDRVDGPCGGWCFKHAMRTIYWFSRPYNLAELYHPDGRLKQIYIHIASPAYVEDCIVRYTDHELDVVKRPGQPLRVVDEDEFDQACSDFGYTKEFQGLCRHAVAEAINLASTWRCSGCPDIPKRSPRPPRRRSGRMSGGQSSVRTSTPAADSSTRRTEV